MVKNNLLWITKAMSTTLTILAVLTGIFLLSEFFSGSFEILVILGLSMFYFLFLPVLIRRTKNTFKSILLSAAVLTAPLVPIGLLVAVKYYIYGKPLNTMNTLMYSRAGRPITIESFMAHWVVFFFCILALGFYFHLRKCTDE